MKHFQIPAEDPANSKDESCVQKAVLIAGQGHSSEDCGRLRHLLALALDALHRGHPAHQGVPRPMDGGPKLCRLRVQHPAAASRYREFVLGA